MSKLIKKILEKIPNPEIDIKKRYKVIRSVLEFFRSPKFKALYKIWDIKIKSKGYNIPVRMFYPKDEGPHPVIIYYHGGGWISNSIDTYSKVCKNIAESTNHIVMSIDYRLSPEYKFPIPFEDCYNATKFIFKNTDKLNIRKDDITIMGDSAGGNIAACVSLLARDKKAFDIKKQILIYPSTIAIHKESMYDSLSENKNNISLSLRQLNNYIDLYKSKEKDFRNPYFAPMNAKDFRNLPNTLIVTAELDPLRDEGEDFGVKLKSAGNEVRLVRMGDIGHGFLSIKSLSATKATMKILNEFLGDEDE